jgi:hypothetical protein
MKAILYAACAALLFAPGCLIAPPKPDAEPKPNAAAPPPHAPAVSEDEVNEKNAREKARALEDELIHARGESPAGGGKK